MNYLDLINSVLQELNYKVVSSFSDLVKPDHEKIKTLVNRKNDELLNLRDWDFLLREKVLVVPAGSDTVVLGDDMRLKSVFVNGLEFAQIEDCTPFLLKKDVPNSFALFSGAILLAPSSVERVVKILYYTKNHAKTEAGLEVPELKSATDETLLPEEFAKSALIYGVCLEFKSNPQHPKYKHWADSLYQAKSKMVATSASLQYHAPKIKLSRWTFGFDRY